MRIPVRLYDQLREAKFDLQARLRRDLDEADVLDLFMGDGFDAWLANRLRREEA